MTGRAYQVRWSRMIGRVAAPGVVLLAGCSGLARPERYALVTVTPLPTTTVPARAAAEPMIRQVSDAQPVLPSPRPVPADPPPFAGLAELTAAGVVAQVLARNPTVAQMAAAAEAAATR